MKNNKIKTLITERLILRELTENDAEDVFRNWTSDDEVSRYVRWSTHKNIKETREYIINEQRNCMKEHYYNWGIVLKEKNELIGAIGAFPSAGKRVELGYNISRKYWNNGYTTEALQIVLKYLINNEHIYKFRCSHDILNPASGAVMKKAGFKYVDDAVYEKFYGSRSRQCKVYNLDIEEEIINSNIRKANREDSYVIAEIIVDGWQTAYKGLIDEKYLKSLSVKDISEKWKDNISNQDEDNNIIYVYEENKKILGVIRFGQTNNSYKEYNSEIYALYVNSKVKRKGIGTKLFEKAKNHFISNNNTNMIIWCLKENEPSIKFYEKMGGRITLERKATVHNIDVEEVGISYNL